MNAPTAGDAAARARSSADDGWLHTFGKVGYAAQGVLWFLLGWAALQLALGAPGGAQPDQSGALATLAGSGPGRVLLVVMALGLAAYALWQAAEAVWGHRGRPPRERTGKRVGAAVKALVAAGLAVTAVRLLANRPAAGGAEEDATARLLAAPGGALLVGAVGAVLVALGGYWVYRGVTASFREKLEPGVDSRIIAFGRVGHVARGVAVGVLGCLVALAALRHDPQEAGGIDAALTALLALPAGQVVLGAVALGLMLFGVFQVMAARHLQEG